MSLAKNIPLIIITVLYFFGRLFEGMRLTDYKTGFLIDAPLVSKSLIVRLVFIIALCNAVILHGSKNKSKNKFIPKIGLIGFAIGAFFITGAISGIKNTIIYGGFLGFDIAIMFSGIGFMIYALSGIKGKNIEKIAFIFIMAGGVSFILNALIFDINTVENKIYTSGNLAHISALSFLLLLFKSQYAPSKTTNISLHWAAFFNAIFSFSGLLATVIGELYNKNTTPSGLLYDCAFILIGILSFYTAVELSRTYRKSIENQTIKSDSSQDLKTENKKSDNDGENTSQNYDVLALHMNGAGVKSNKHKGKLSAAIKDSNSIDAQKNSSGLNADVIRSLFGPEAEDEITEELPKVKNKKSFNSSKEEAKPVTKIKPGNGKKIFISKEKSNSHDHREKRVFKADDN